MAVTQAAAEVCLDTSTHTTAPTNLTLLQYGGDLLDEPTADRTVQWLLATLGDSSTFEARTTPSYLVDKRLIDTLAGVVAAASPNARASVVQCLTDLPAQDDQLRATSWAGVVTALPDHSWNEQSARVAGERAAEHHEVLELLFLEVAARYDATVKAQLIDRAGAPSMDALSVVRDARDLTPEAASNLITLCATRAEEIVNEAHHQMAGFGHDWGRALAILNVWHPDCARWDPLLRLLSDPAVSAAHKRMALHALASLADHIPDDVKDA